jgi:hypothetical protein
LADIATSAHAYTPTRERKLAVGPEGSELSSKPRQIVMPSSKLLIRLFHL